MARLLSSADRAERNAVREVQDLVLPAWRKSTDGEQRWPAAIAIAAMIVLQLSLPDHLMLGERWVMPAVQAVILVVLFAANPRRMNRSSMALRTLGLLLIAVASLANAWSVGQLVVGLANGTETDNAAALLMTGADIWLTNVIVFALWYWELDRGGPVDRAYGVQPYPDLLFAQMTAPDMAPTDWEPRFVDYLYVSFTNATAFSPTDTLPLSRWAKLAMMLQSAVSLLTAALVIARAVNILA
ncbi:MAG TPA: hypothetical protein VFO77_05480 [Actinoplanes sp.]|nr:hypothetical protein [Actinoplanes sp.]